jgi:hypothetical protein
LRPALLVGKAETQQIQPVLALKTHAFLTILANKGTHGTSPVDVAKTLIGIRRAIREGHLTPEDVNAVQGKK